MNGGPNASYPVPWWKRPWFLGPLLRGGLVLIGLLSLSLIRGAAVSPKFEKKAIKVQQVQGRTESTVAATPRVNPMVAVESTSILKSQIEKVLTGIKEANQKKDLSQLLSYYSPSFTHLAQRTQSFSKNWKVYNYPKMDFEIEDVRLLSENDALIRVTWNVEVQNIISKRSKDISKAYKVKFVKDSGHWRIKALEKVE
jgi:hypothetical protein